MSDQPMSEAPVSVSLGGRPVGPAAQPFVIAELSANHGGSLEQAKQVIGLAAEAGADAVKLQTFTPESMTLDLDRPPFVAGPETLWAGRSLYSLYEEAQTPYDWHPELFALAADLGLACLSTPFDRAAVDFLEQFDPPAHKIASFELLDHRLIGHAAATGRPLIMSTGMATETEIDEAVDAARAGGDGGVVLLRCNSAYPADPAEMDLAAIPAMAERWRVPVGLSDHSPGTTAAVAATALGACVFEKHVIADRADGGPDAAFSIEPAELAELVSQVSVAHAALGSVRFGPSPAEQASVAFRRSLWVIADVAEGEPFTEANVAALRPAGGLDPKHLGGVLGRPATIPLSRGTAVQPDHIGR